MNSGSPRWHPKPTTPVGNRFIHSATLWRIVMFNKIIWNRVYKPGSVISKRERFCAKQVNSPVISPILLLLICIHLSVKCVTAPLRGLLLVPPEIYRAGIGHVTTSHTALLRIEFTLRKVASTPMSSYLTFSSLPVSAEGWLFSHEGEFISP